VSSDKQKNYTEKKKLGTNFVENRLIKLAKRENFISAWQIAKVEFISSKF